MGLTFKLYPLKKRIKRRHKPIYVFFFIVCFKNNFISFCSFYDIAMAAALVCEQRLGLAAP